MIGDEPARSGPEYTVNPFRVFWKIKLLANCKRYLSYKPYCVGLKFLVCSEVGFNKDFKCVTNLCAGGDRGLDHPPSQHP